MKRAFLCLVVITGLASCAGDRETRAINSLAIACDTFATIGEQLVPLRKAGKLSLDNIRRVDTANKIVRPVCSKEHEIVDPVTAIKMVEQGIGLLKQIKGN